MSWKRVIIALHTGLNTLNTVLKHHSFSVSQVDVSHKTDVRPMPLTGLFYEKQRMGSWRNPVRILINEPGPSPAPVVQKLDSAVRRINHYPVDSKILGKPFALSSGKRFIGLIALSSFWTTETSSLSLEGEYSAYFRLSKYCHFIGNAFQEYSIVKYLWSCEKLKVT